MIESSAASSGTAGLTHATRRTISGEAGRVTYLSGPLVRRATSSDVEDIARVLADAFSDYPWTRWTVDGRDHGQRIAALQRLALERIGLPYGQVWVACVDDRIEAAAVWMDSRTPLPSSAWEAMAHEQRSLEGDRHEASRAAEAAIARLRPELPHLYLATVGTTGRSQRRGLGSAVLAPGLAAADDAGLSAFLETSSDDNLAFYRRLGFEIVDEVQIEGGPPVWAMSRGPTRS
jgi:predicted N-acetyltransferase YhbS